MTDESLERAEQDLIYLARCAVNGGKADPSRLGNLDALFALASRHLLSGMVAMTLEKSGVCDPRVSAAIRNAFRRAFLFQQTCEQVQRELSSAGIWHMPLKGAELKKYYPVFGMREMADVDVLVDPTRTDDVRSVMEKLGFKANHFGVDCHDCYFKEPCLDFEMHRSLFTLRRFPKFDEYYKDVYSRLIGDGFSKRFTPEDFYLYFVAHEFKHYSSGGTGLRSLLDTYLYLQKEQLDMEYVTREATKLGFADFEASIRALSSRILEHDEILDSDRATIKYILSSGAGGTVAHLVQNRIGKGKWRKLRYALRRFCVPVNRKNPRYEIFSNLYPFFYKHKLALPLLPFYRIYRSIKRGRFLVEANALKDLR